MVFFPFPVKHNGMFAARWDLIREFSQEKAGDTDYLFNSHLPDAEEIYKYLQLVSKDNLSAEYLKKLLLDDEIWKWTAAIADLANLYTGVTKIIERDIPRSFFMTNTGGHHSDNAHYELFCPINHLFFLTEVLNYQSNFPSIYWVDTDAHFGNGDKTLWDLYKQRMRTETNNLSGVSFHNDAGNMNEDGYQGIMYSRDISITDFLQMLEKNIQIPRGTKYFLTFIGTDIFFDDYGGNQNITLDALPQILSILKSKCDQAGCVWLAIQTGGTRKDNIRLLIDEYSNSTK